MFIEELNTLCSLYHSFCETDSKAFLIIIMMVCFDGIERERGGKGKRVVKPLKSCNSKGIVCRSQHLSFVFGLAS
jgi:hypothetical protein